MYYLLSIIFLSLHLMAARGADIQKVQLFHHKLVVKEGQELLIPCKFIMDDHNTGLEWSVMPTGSDSFSPIIQLDNTKLLPVSHPNNRASIDPMGVSKGDCSLLIKPVKTADSGTYQIRIGRNDQETEGTTKQINLRVQKRGRSSEDTKTYPTSQPTTTTNKQQQTKSLFSRILGEPFATRMAKMSKYVKSQNPFVQWMIGVAIFLVLLLVVSALAALLHEVPFCCMKRCGINTTQLKEKKHSSHKPSNVIKRDERRDKSPKDSKIQPHKKRHQTSHFRPQMKEDPKKLDVTIDMGDIEDGTQPKTPTPLSTPRQSENTEHHRKAYTVKVEPKKQDVYITIQDPTEDQSPQEDIQPNMDNKQISHIALQMEEPTKKLDVKINIGDITAHRQQPERDDPSSPAEEQATPMDPEEGNQAAELQPQTTNQSDGSDYYEFLGVRWIYNRGRYQIYYPKNWDWD